ncbi:leucine-rich repeat domain-containing protein [Croceitalea rosinachiae]|uniref:Leucine-rich repeat domain-containing protein n=1 Tax=Croceitalea rosinachiae TaxID=3075596 RepID=A0ABU3A9K4_9FLAO|nr:leucine-rich repeat domain-containing protein [Croceitalea sp. F388]MDT0606882.1 leucine-rich repeat domain-containing protein [Croceitalea sp. F388]
MKTSKLSTLLLALVLFSGNLLTAQDEVSQREVIALLELKAKTKGHLWTNQWDESKPITTWHGVTIKDGKVVGLDLSNNNLQGKIPITIGNLRNLETLDLSNNNIKGKIPGLFRKFDNLKEVDLGKNELTGNIPSSINQLQNLQELNLSNNKLEGALPKTINTLSKLNTLALANNDLNGPMPVGMENLKKLKKLYISNNEFSDMNSLRPLAEQQTVLTDVKLTNGNMLPIDFTKSKEGLSKLEFEDYKEQE